MFLADATDGILRKADLPIVDSKVCNDFLASAASSSGNDNLNKGLGDGFLCARGSGEEESCFVSHPCSMNKLHLDIKI
jgi:hypothetical protein